MDINKLKSLDKKYIANTYARFNIALMEGMGSLAYDINGKEYIDLTSGIGVNIFGFSDPGHIGAIVSQLTKIQHASNLFYTEPMILLAEKLCKRTGLKKIFFANSGAEANEGAIKLARKYSSKKYKDKKRREIITLKNSFHGRTLGAISATGQDSFHKDFDPFLPGFRYTEANDI
ncbi:MAG: aminotransferase class III-fold pyridoxal phosphate-dependent enzyme, partial [Clostridiales Family XIII bacterium]|nr:aminotransferase class III-fold pyridoxal phosphate-dependent enzyme [Clostridiales Family XIII bacterium]